MRHRKAGRKLNRTSSHRKALLKNLAIALIEQDLIKTTLPKAKELRKFVEPLITLGKEDTVANRRLAFRRLRSDAAVGESNTLKLSDALELYLKLKGAGKDKVFVRTATRNVE